MMWLVKMENYKSFKRIRDNLNSVMN